MQVINSIAQLKEIRDSIPKEQAIGFVPTMGNLHKGHASLIKRSTAENDQTFLSIFINPTQFNNPKDYQNYPKTFEDDLNLAEQLHVSYVFMPTEEVLYPDHYTYQIQEIAQSQQLEGEFRPGHFKGMLTCVLKLLLLIQAHHAYFGEKDYQQLQLVKGLAQAFFVNTKIVSCPTVREESGLPLSSRNNLLTPKQREQAKLFPFYFHQNLPCDRIKELLISEGFEVDYIIEQGTRRFAAVTIGSIRLIDNFEGF